MIIANSDYDEDGNVNPDAALANGYERDLSNPQADASAVHSLLTEDFQIGEVQRDLNHDQMYAALLGFSKTVGEADKRADLEGLPRPVVLVYFAGHGVEFDSANYIVPVGAKLPGKNELNGLSADAARMRLARSAIPVNDLLSLFGGRGSGTTIIILDACRDNKWKRSVRGDAPQGLAYMPLTGSVLLVTSAEPGNVANDGDPGAISPFAKAFLKFGQRRDLSFLDAFAEITNAVLAETKDAQRPWLTGSPARRFCLLECAPSSVATATDPETLLWDAANSRFDPMQGTTHEDMLRAYLSFYPTGQYAETARRWLTVPTAPVISGAADGAPCKIVDEAFVYFEWNRNYVTVDGFKIIEQIASKYQPGMRVHIESATDSAFAAGYAMELTLRQSRSVADILVARGVNAEQVIMTGHGESGLNGSSNSSQGGVREPLNRVTRITVCQ